MKQDTYLYTNKGGRSLNEDSAAFLEENGHGIYIVADGLGGHQYGHLASKCITDSLIENWSAVTEEDRAELLAQQIAAANQKLLDLQEEKHCTMKSTVAVLTIDDKQAVWAHSGDSRIYYFHNKAIWEITEDHSVSYKKYKAGDITRAQIGQDEDQSCLLRTLGGRERWTPDIYVHPEPMECGDAFLLCSDGAWEYLYDEEILIDLLKSASAKEWAELLLLRIIARLTPKNDNLTLLTIKLG